MFIFLDSRGNMTYNHTVDRLFFNLFGNRFIIAAAKKAGLKLVEEAKFTEKGRHRAMYEKQNLWGGFKITEFFEGITRRPVKLTWFVLRK